MPGLLILLLQQPIELLEHTREQHMTNSLNKLSHILTMLTIITLIPFTFNHLGTLGSFAYDFLFTRNTTQTRGGTLHHPPHPAWMDDTLGSASHHPSHCPASFQAYRHASTAPKPMLSQADAAWRRCILGRPTTPELPLNGQHRCLDST